MANFEDLKIGKIINVNNVDCEIIDIFVHFNSLGKEFVTKIKLKVGRNTETWNAKDVFKLLNKTTFKPYFLKNLGKGK